MPSLRPLQLRRADARSHHATTPDWMRIDALRCCAWRPEEVRRSLSPTAGSECSGPAWWRVPIHQATSVIAERTAHNLHVTDGDRIGVISVSSTCNYTGTEFVQFALSQQHAFLQSAQLQCDWRSVWSSRLDARFFMTNATINYYTLNYQPISSL